MGKREKPPVPDHLPPPAELLDTECRHSNALGEAIVKAIKANYGGCSDYEVVGALEYVKRWYMSGACDYKGYQEQQQEDDDGVQT